MVTRQNNNSRSGKTSMVEELLDLVSEEEYLDMVPVFDGTNYLNRVELAALKKMISGKLCVECRKLHDQQNQAL